MTDDQIDELKGAAVNARRAGADYWATLFEAAAVALAPAAAREVEPAQPAQNHARGLGDCSMDYAEGWRAAHAATQADPIVAAVCADLSARSQLGQAKYGTTLARTDLSRKDWLRHAYEEALDLACYLRRAMEDEP